jgi:predicted Zn-dependent protease
MLNDAIDTLQSGLALRPEERYLRANLGDTYLQMGNLVEAEKIFRELIRTDADFPFGYRGLAIVFNEQKKYDQAEAMVRNANQLSPKDLGGRLFLAKVLSDQQKYSEADAAFREALKLAPDNPLALNNFGYSLVERGEKLEEALEMIQRAVDAAPANGSFLDSLGWAYFKMGKLAEAVRYLNDAVNSGTQSPTIHEHLAEVYSKTGKTDEARAAILKALSLSKDADQIARLKAKLNPDGIPPGKKVLEKKEPAEKKPNSNQP